jgi:hypothetical protein
LTGLPSQEDLIHSSEYEVQIGIFDSIDSIAQTFDVPTGADYKNITKFIVASLRQNLAVEYANTVFAKTYSVRMETYDIYEHRNYTNTLISNDGRVLGQISSKDYFLSRRETRVTTRLVERFGFRGATNR